MKKSFLLFIALLLCGGAEMRAREWRGREQNPTFSPDSSMVAYTGRGNLWLRSVADSNRTQLTIDGGRGILNGYASWVYYEEILGRPTKYRAFWWSPDSRRVAFYRFDERNVTVFPIYSPAGRAASGSLRRTRYPLAGEKNPQVRIGIYDIETGITVWAGFNENEDQYFGTPFWSADGSELYVQRMPRRQNTLDLYAVSASDGSLRRVYHEEYPTWIDWIENAVATEDGLYMVRDFRTGWQQIYFLSYDGKTFKQLTDRQNWDMTVLKADNRSGSVWFTAKCDNRLHNSLYRVDRHGRVTVLTDPQYNAARPHEEDGVFRVTLSNAGTQASEVTVPFNSRRMVTIASPQSIDTVSRAHPRPVVIDNEGFDLYGLISYPKGFDSSRSYPVVMQVYGGPGVSYVRDFYNSWTAYNDWCYLNDIIFITVNPRSSGENGRRGMDQAFGRMTVVELDDYIAWAEWLQGLPYVDGSRIGVYGFSFGGTTTAMLVLRYPEYFRCGIAGGGVYDWRLYDSHYTERYMMTPDDNRDGYNEACVLKWVPEALDPERDNIKPLPGALRITHGTGDDNVHLQNTLLLIDALQKQNYQFELMLYPDGMHGYDGAQAVHSDTGDGIFWTRWLLDRTSD